MMTKGLVKPLYFRILSKFPPNFSFCFAYGSGVKKQLGYDDPNCKTLPQHPKEEAVPKKHVMIDLMFTVENPYNWHAQNMLTNPSHYSSMRLLGSNAIARYQENYAAKVYFNTLVPLDDELYIKYGVMSAKDLVVDLLDWRDLYVAGRLQKPVEIIRSPTNSKVHSALELNLQSAIHAALLLLPKEFTEYELFCAITSLSYNGDFRMIFGENRNKVQNIVKPQMDSFRALYHPVAEVFKDVLEYSIEANPDNVVCRQDKSPVVTLQHLSQLPKWPIRRIVKNWNRGKYRMDTEDVMRAVACSPMCQEIVRRALSDIVWQSSIKQSIKNIPTAGASKSLQYSWSKALKTFNL